MITRLLLITLVVCFATAANIHAQDGHYWSENYGNRSMLLSGTVNASVEDLGAVFYNPGRLGLIENPAFAISAKVYEWRTLSIKNSVDEGVDLNKSNFGGAPSLAAGTFKLPFLEGHKFAYSFLTRQRTSVDFFVRVEKQGNVTDYLPGEELFNGKVDLQSQFKEEWMGLTWAPPASGKLSIGLSTFISTLNKSALIGLDMNALNDTGQVGYYTVNHKYSYNTYGLLWKLGLAMELEKIRLGLTVTTPRINLSGKGSTLFEDYLVGVDTSEVSDGIIDDGYIFNIQDGLPAKYKSPWAIGFGIGIPFKKGILHMSAEWYSLIPEYNILNIDPFVGQSTGDTVKFVLHDRLESVINLGIGVEWNFSEKISGYASIATDHSSVPNEIDRFSDFKEKATNSLFQTDFYQFGGGIAVNTKAVEITVGATYKGASQTFENNLDFPGEETDGLISKITFSQWRFILGFSFPFAQKFADKLEGKQDE